MSDITDFYYPASSEINSEDFQTIRESLALIYAERFPDLDTREGSVFGDLWLTPAAMHLSSSNTAVQRFKSDLDLANVVDGTIWDCDFVEQYLKNFTTVQELRVLPYGVVRLSFDPFSSSFEINKGIKFYPSGADQNSVSTAYEVWTPHEGDIEILPPQSARAQGANQYVASENGTQYVVDLVIRGETALDVDTQMDTDKPVDGLTSATVLFNFQSGQGETRLKEIAKLTRETVYAATPTTKGGVRSFLRRNFPDFLGVSPINSGDPDMQRSGVNADIYVRSGIDFTDNLTFQAQLVGSDFVATISLQGIPYLVDSITSPNAIAQSEGSEVILSPSITQVPMQPSLTPGLSGTASNLLNYQVTIPMPLDDALDPLIVTDIIGGDEFANFVITYRQDPLATAFGELVTSENNLPIGVSVLYKGPVTVVLESLVVKYTKDANKAVDLGTARSEILEYVNGVLYPDHFQQARIYDSMFYNGARNVRDIEVRATVRYGGISDSTVTEWLDIDLLTEYVTGPSGSSVSPENVRYILDSVNLEFDLVD